MGVRRTLYVSQQRNKKKSVDSSRSPCVIGVCVFGECGALKRIERCYVGHVVEPFAWKLRKSLFSVIFC